MRVGGLPVPEFKLTGCHELCDLVLDVSPLLRAEEHFDDVHEVDGSDFIDGGAGFPEVEGDIVDGFDGELSHEGEEQL